MGLRCIMRLVSTECLKDGDIIGKDIISDEGGVLLRHHTSFKEIFKHKLIERNIFEVYIEDEISAGIEPVQLITSEVKNKIFKDMKRQFENLKTKLTIEVEEISEITRFLIQELEKKEMVVELSDLKANDLYTYEHCIAVAILTELVCTKMGLSAEVKEQTVMGALIHDIGKIILPKDILNKPGKLTEEEYELVKGHAEIGYGMIKKNSEVSAITKLTVLCHHEREDGSGYPLGKGEDLHISAKIVGACDLFHALISDRCYRQGLPINEAVMIAQKQAINPQIRQTIENFICFYPVGCMVLLSNGSLAIVEKNFAADIRNPLVRVISHFDGEFIACGRLYLMEEENINIVRRYNEKLK